SVMADALEIPPPEGRGSAWRALSKRAWRPQAGRPSRGGSVLLPEGGAGRAPTDREEVGDLEVGDLAHGSVFSLEGSLTKRSRQRAADGPYTLRIANAILGRAPSEGARNR